MSAIIYAIKRYKPKYLPNLSITNKTTRLKFVNTPLPFRFRFPRHTSTARAQMQFVIASESPNFTEFTYASMPRSTDYTGCWHE